MTKVDVANDARVKASDFPLEVVSYKGQPIAIVKAAAIPTLPFTMHACDVRRIGSHRELGDVQCHARHWKLRFKLTISLSTAVRNHWLLLSSRGPSSLPSASIAFEGTPAGVEAVNTFLKKIGAEVADGDYHVYFVSQPNQSDIKVAPVLSEAKPHEHNVTKLTDKVSERVLFADSMEDAVGTLVDVLREALLSTPAASPGSQTAVFWPAPLTFPVNIHSKSEALRIEEHDGLLLPWLRLLHWPQRQTNWVCVADLKPPPTPDAAQAMSWRKHLLSNPHLQLKSGPSPINGAHTCLTTGVYDYYHYHVDGFNDDGWGCAYRSAQTILSWFHNAGLMTDAVPSIRRIQEILLEVDAEKKNYPNFVGSKTWIGSFEIMLLLQYYLPDLQCTLKRLESGAELDTDPAVQGLLLRHFTQPSAPPVMIGGSSYAHTIIGVHMNQSTMEAEYLVLDPHYTANPTQLKTVLNKGYVGWKSAKQFFESGSWYNICVPRVDLYDPR